ncbi:MAG TPA: hypothetical protein VMT58_06720, partial [Candidatus Binataceae bacterium]|nr:hypothetical protein [Candidatus Binataceae bacterium]
DKPLRLGLSVEVSIDIRNRSGPLLTSLVQGSFEQGGRTIPNEKMEVPPIPRNGGNGEAPPPPQPSGGQPVIN